MQADVYLSLFLLSFFFFFFFFFPFFFSFLKKLMYAFKQEDIAFLNGKRPKPNPIFSNVPFVVGSTSGYQLERTDVPGIEYPFHY
jgi:hypothetical protein